MTHSSLRARQDPLKQKYRDDPASASVTMRAEGQVDLPSFACHIQSPHGPITAGLHPAAGGSGSEACSAEMLLESLVACAGVTLAAVASAMALPLLSAKIIAEGTMDFRGTLAVDRLTPVGLTEIHLTFDLQGDLSQEQREKLLQLTERYCVIFQTLKQPIPIHSGVVGR